MKHVIISILFLLLLSKVFPQKIENNRDLIEKSKVELEPALKEYFLNCIVKTDFRSCTEKLVSLATDEYKMYVIGSALYNIDPEISFKLHEQVYLKKPTELSFILEYAVENHRKGRYEEAIELYETYKKEVKEDYRTDVWLSECYINIGNLDKSIEHWRLANHPNNHTGIDKAIHAIHGRTDQIQIRSNLIENIKNKDKLSAYELIFLDMNWEIDWWNKKIQNHFLENDLRIIKKRFGKNSSVYKHLIAYKLIKDLSIVNQNPDSIKYLFKKTKLLIDGNVIPPNGKISSDLLRIGLFNGIINENDFLKSRGNELLKLADTYKDAHLLNMYAYLESIVYGHVSEQIDKKGWQEYKDERFAISYFMGLADKNRYDNPDLAKAIEDFPNSSKIHWVKLNTAKLEGKSLKKDLIEIIKKEFKTLGSDPKKYSYTLTLYLHLLEKEK